MERTLTRFVRALRLADVSVSPAESIDAVRALDIVGYADRDRMKDALSCVLAKTEAEKRIHDSLFDLFFASREKTDAEAVGAADSPEQDAPDNGAPPGPAAGGGEVRQGGEGADAAQGQASGSAQPREHLIVELHQSGDAARANALLQQAAARQDVDRISFRGQIGYFTRRMMEELGVRELEAELVERYAGRTPEDKARAGALMEARSAVQARAREIVEERYDIFGEGAAQAMMNDAVANRSLGQLDRLDMERTKALTEKLARKLAERHSRRRRKARRGALDLRKTLRRSAGLDAAPFNLSWKRKKRDRPKIVAVCDVSGSVASYVRFLLLLLSSLKDVAPDIRTFAFSGGLMDVGPILQEPGPIEARMNRIIRVAGMGSTDYGQAFDDLMTDHGDAIDRRATLLILGDGRSNNGDIRMDLFRDMTARARRTVWLNPEHPRVWGTGDSEIPRFAPFCTTMRQVSTLKDLERAVDEILACYG